MFETLIAELAGPAVAFLQVVMIDLVLAGDNAVAVGMAAGRLPAEQRKKVILYGLGAAVAMRITFALITTWLLGIIGLLLAGGLLLLWVCWKMWRELHEGHQDELDAQAVLDNDPGSEPRKLPAKTFRQAFIQILIADLSMSLDNVLAVAGAAREHPVVLIFGLLLSIALMGLAAHWIAGLLSKHRWVGYLGLLVVLYVALHMVWQGHRQVVADLGETARYNAVMPSFLDITPDEAATLTAH